MNLPALNDSEGDRIPDSFPPVIDSHVHLFPHKIFSAVWNWFDKHGWPVRYQSKSTELIQFLLSRGVKHIVALQYAHVEGMADYLNQYMVQICNQFPDNVTGMATVFPGEKDAAAILKKAFKSGLKGVKLHAHVQCFDMNSEEMEVIYEVCSTENKPLIMHVSREPKSEAYACDPYQICSVDKLENVLRSFPQLKVCVPHLGVDEFMPYKNLIEKYDSLWLDTAMVLTDYLIKELPYEISELRADRVMYGSDFPNIPYAWDRELKWIDSAGLSQHRLEQLLVKNAQALFNIPE